jgi:hypothetical protein
MSPLQITTAQWQVFFVATWLLFLWVLLAGSGAFSLAASIIVVPSLEATNQSPPWLSRLRPLFTLGAVLLLGAAILTMIAILVMIYPVMIEIYPRVWI